MDVPIHMAVQPGDRVQPVLRMTADPVADRIRLIRDKAGDAGDAGDLSLPGSDYQRGQYNGCELALSVLEDRQPVLIQPCGPGSPERRF